MFGWTRGQRQTIVRACASIAFTQGAMQSLQLLLWLSETYIYKEEKPLPGRLELPTLRLTASRSNQLSYGSTMIILKVKNAPINCVQAAARWCLHYDDGRRLFESHMSAKQNEHIKFVNHEALTLPKSSTKQILSQQIDS